MSRPVLLLTQDECLVQAARLEIYARSALDLVVARTLEEGLTHLADGQPCAVVIHLDAGLSDEQVSQVLWAASLPPRAVPVLALSDRYDESRAQTLFQLGITDYLGRVEHLASLASLLTSIVPSSPAATEASAEQDARNAVWAVSRLPEGTIAPSITHLPGLQRFSILGEG
jgi:DNA-binding response OmpR family regulator